MVSSLFIFGLGYSSQEIARYAQAAGFSVAGTCRTVEKCQRLAEQGITAYPFDAVPAEALAQATHILSSVPPQEGQGDVVLSTYAHVFSNAWLGYLSTTGVYGDWQGQWVNEDSPCRPNNARLERRVVAEQAWLKRGGHVFRLAGIYGLGRNALEDVRAGVARRIDKAGQVFSRIHVADIAQTVLASMNIPNPASIYNVCDDEPAAAADVVAFACQLLGAPVPALVPYAEAELSAMGREFYSANRRVNNQKIKNELGVSLHYPHYRQGLTAMLEP
jgi:nucleoside-diphosphate-sugar epimerase